MARRHIPVHDGKQKMPSQLTMNSFSIKQLACTRLFRRHRPPDCRALLRSPLHALAESVALDGAVCISPGETNGFEPAAAIVRFANADATAGSACAALFGISSASEAAAIRNPAEALGFESAMATEASHNPSMMRSFRAISSESVATGLP